MKKIELKEGVVYHMNEIGIENLKLNNITSNRKDKKQIENKLKSCESTGMQVPAVITELKHCNGSRVSTSKFSDRR